MFDKIEKENQFNLNSYFRHQIDIFPAIKAVKN